MAFIRNTKKDKEINLSLDGWSLIGQIHRSSIRESLPNKTVTRYYSILTIGNRDIPTYPCLFLFVIGKEIFYIGKATAEGGFKSRFSSGYSRITDAEMSSLFGNSARINNLMSQYLGDGYEVEVFLKNVSDLSYSDIMVDNLKAELFSEYDEPDGNLVHPRKRQ